jgi:YesN/AraC family two-component response regulator
MYRLFLADDENIVVRGLKKLLDWHSLHIEIIGEATNGREAEEAILRLNPDLVILDIRMPNRTGLDILRAIKKEKLETKVIFISAHKDFNYAREALELGALNYLVKPINTEKLKSSVEDALRRIDARAEARAAMGKLFRMEKDTLVSKRGCEKEIIPEFIKCQNNSQIRDILLFMDSHYSENITLKKIAKKAYLNPFYFSVYFKKNSGVCFKDCLTRIRMEHALNILKREDIKTWELAERVGFQDPQYFSALFKKVYGTTPMEYKKGIRQ